MSRRKTVTESQEYAESIINTVREPLIVLDQDLGVVTASRSFYEFFKVKPEETVGQLIYDLGNKQWDIPKLRELLETILPQKASFDNYEVKHDFTTIGRRIMLLNARQIQRASGKKRIILLAIEDITERKQLQEEMGASEERFRRAFDTSQNVLLLVHKTEGDILNSNKSAQEMFGYSEEDILKMKLWELGVVKSYEDFRDEVSRSEKDGAAHCEEILIKTKQGQDIKAEVFLVDREKVVQCNIRDITERKRAEEQIRKNLREKEILIRELYHRTKNNMQVICSLIKLKTSKLKDNQTKEFFKEIETRIYSMALVHQKLLGSKDLSHLNLKDYFDSLLIHLKYSFSELMNEIAIHTEMADVTVLIDTAVPLGLVFTELVSNIVKHAFPDHTGGEIKVQLYRNTQNEIVLEISDNGIGFPKGFDIQKDIHFGLETVIDLVEQQLNGKIDFKSRKGLHCQIVLKEELYKPRVES
ncbi:PAS domain S-box protein [bacterium]|nr:MAG: PAS domain S-box protein [bacterium]